MRKQARQSMNSAQCSYDASSVVARTHRELLDMGRCRKHNRCVLVVALSIRWLTAVVLIVAAVAKLGEAGAGSFAVAITRYEIIPTKYVTAAARLIPLTELTIGSFLAVGVFVKPAAVAASLLFAVFALAIAINVKRGKHFDCGCGIGSPTTISWKHVSRGGVLAGLAVLVAVEPAVFGVAVDHVKDAPATNTLLAVPFCVVLVCVSSRLLDPVRETFRALRTHSRASMPQIVEVKS